MIGNRKMGRNIERIVGRIKGGEIKGIRAIIGRINIVRI